MKNRTAKNGRKHGLDGKYPFFAAVALLFMILPSSCAGKKAAPVAQAKPEFKMIEVPASLTTIKERCEYVVLHYWDNFDFSDTTYIRYPEVTEQAFADFLEVAQLPQTDYATACTAIESTLLKAEPDTVMLNYFLGLYEKYLYDANSPMRNEEYYIPVLEYTIASPAVPELEKIRPQFRLDMARKNRVGETASDFVYTTAAGVSAPLSKIKSEYVILYFNNPDCTACKEIKMMMNTSPVLTNLISSGRVKVLALYPDADLQIWKNHLSDFPSSWINGYDKERRIETEKIYDLKAIPTLYLLDKDKRIILKDANFEKIEAYLAQH